jgi:hypothetical protein
MEKPINFEEAGWLKQRLRFQESHLFLSAVFHGSESPRVLRRHYFLRE